MKVKIKETGEIVELSFNAGKNFDGAAEMINSYGYKPDAEGYYHLTLRDYKRWQQAFENLEYLDKIFVEYAKKYGDEALDKRLSKVSTKNLDAWINAMLREFSRNI